MKLAPTFLDFAVCPQCHSPLKESAPQGGERDAELELVCTSTSGCGLAYPVRDGIPVLLVDEARRPDRRR